jgi:hypothetical protein
MIVNCWRCEALSSTNEKIHGAFSSSFTCSDTAGYFNPHRYSCACTVELMVRSLDVMRANVAFDVWS